MKTKDIVKNVGVEFVDSRIRRYQMGYIKLACPVAHVWHLKGLLSNIANLLDKPHKKSCAHRTQRAHPPASPSVGDQTSRWMLLDSREGQQSGESRRTCSGGAGPPGSSTRQAVRTRRGGGLSNSVY
jgi:hypothetical protein